MYSSAALQQRLALAMGRYVYGYTIGNDISARDWQSVGTVSGYHIKRFVRPNGADRRLRVYARAPQSPLGPSDQADQWQ